jgi:hypothetical protein
MQTETVKGVASKSVEPAHMEPTDPVGKHAEDKTREFVADAEKSTEPAMVQSTTQPTTTQAQAQPEAAVGEKRSRGEDKQGDAQGDAQVDKV